MPASGTSPLPSSASDDGSGTVVGGGGAGGPDGVPAVSMGGGVTEMVSAPGVLWPLWMNGMKKAGMSASGRKRECGPAAAMYDGTSSTMGGKAGGTAVAICGIGTTVSGSGPTVVGATGRMGRHMTSAGSLARAGALWASDTTGWGRGRRCTTTCGRLCTGFAATLGRGLGLGAAFAAAGRGRWRTRGRLRTGLTTAGRRAGVATGTHCTSVSVALAVDTGPWRTAIRRCGCVERGDVGLGCVPGPCATAVDEAVAIRRAMAAREVKRTTESRQGFGEGNIRLGEERPVRRCSAVAIEAPAITNGGNA